MSLNIDKILIPAAVGSESGFSLGRYAIRAVKDLVGDRKCEVVLMYKTGEIDAADLPPEDPTRRPGVYRAEVGKLKKTFAVIGERLESLQETAQANGLDAVTEIVADSDSTAEAICKRAEEAECGLIIMCSHGRRGLKKFMLGSVAENVVKQAEVPVLVLRGPKVEE